LPTSLKPWGGKILSSSTVYQLGFPLAIVNNTVPSPLNSGRVPDTDPHISPVSLLYFKN